MKPPGDPKVVQIVGQAILASLRVDRHRPARVSQARFPRSLRLLGQYLPFPGR